MPTEVFCAIGRVPVEHVSFVVKVQSTSKYQDTTALGTTSLFCSMIKATIEIIHKTNQQKIMTGTTQCRPKVLDRRLDLSSIDARTILQ